MTYCRKETASLGTARQFRSSFLSIFFSSFPCTIWTLEETVWWVFLGSRSILFSNGKGLVGGAVCRGKTSFHRGSRSFLTSRIRNLQRAWNRTRARVTQKDGRAGKRRPHDRVQEVYVGTHTQALRRFLCEIAMPLQGYTLVFSTRQVLEIFSLRHHLIPLLPESLAWFFGGFYGAGLRLERARFRNLEGE